LSLEPIAPMVQILHDFNKNPKIFICLSKSIPCFLSYIMFVLKIEIGFSAGVIYIPQIPVAYA